ncbi:universal stress protein [Streptomyces sp. NPDC101225]|uniref:universal stress protein n=1 Tax=Streptomyces sp. NPDC101225 TaxID=3366135 RepID=UPI0038293328
MSTITVGLDGSPQSLAAADWAAREAEQREAVLLLVHGWDQTPYVHPPLGGIPAPGAVDTQGTWAKSLLRQTRSRLADRHPALRIETEHSGDHPVAALLAAAEDADLLVLGSRGLGTVAGLLVGSVALALVARVERPVVLVRADERAVDEHLPDASGTESTGTPYRDVVLGIDLEQPGESVIRFAFEAAQRRAAGLRVVHGWSLPASRGYGAAMDVGLNEEQAGLIRQRLTQALRPWQEKFPGVDVREQAVIGSAGRHLVQASRDAALIVVGRTNRRAAVGSHIGPVTHAVLQHAVAPVAVVPHD